MERDRGEQIERKRQGGQAQGNRQRGRDREERYGERHKRDEGMETVGNT